MDKNSQAFTFAALSSLFVVLLLHSPHSLSAEIILTQSFKKEIISEVTRLLEDKYVYPDRGKVAANELNHRFETGYFDEINDPQTFANRITGILDVISDLHLWVNYQLDPIPEDYNHLNPSPGQQIEQAALLRRRNYGFEKVERLPGNLGYIELRDFHYEAETSEEVLANVMKFVRFTDGLIIDLRRNGGGDPEMVSLFLSYLIEGETLIGTFRYREENKVEEHWTRGELAGPHYTEARPVYILMSQNTFSAAESFSYILQARNRAVLVGERTPGGANPSDNVRLHEHFMMSIPMAMSVDPITQSNWQYVGVRPDHDAPADEALTLTQRLILEEQIANSDESDSRREKEFVLRQLVN